MARATHKNAIYCEDADCRGCLERRFKHNLPLVRFLVRKYFPNCKRPGFYGPDRDFDDLVQAGAMGLWHACLRRNPAKSDAEWRGYAATCIHGYIHTSMRDLGKDAYKRINDGQLPHVTSIDFHAVPDRSNPAEPRENYLVRVALDKLVDQQHMIGNRVSTLGDSDAQEKSAMLQDAIDRLPPRLRIALQERLHDKTLQQAAVRLGITRERVRQLQTKALIQVYHMLRGKLPTDDVSIEMTHALSIFEGNV